MKYKYIGDYKGYTIAQRDVCFTATAWDCYTNAPKEFYSATTQKKLERMIDKGA